MKPDFDPVGYQVNRDPGELLFGDRGRFYDYILAGNGLFIEAHNHLLATTVRIADVLVRGLEPYQEKLALAHGEIPAQVYDMLYGLVCETPGKEQYLAVTWEDGRYLVNRPAQEGSVGRVKYQATANVVLDVHSHGRLSPARFSAQDDEDEQGLRLYLVFGKVSTPEPEVQIRLGVYGYFKYLELGDVFDGL